LVSDGILLWGLKSYENRLVFCRSTSARYSPEAVVFCRSTSARYSHEAVYVSSSEEAAGRRNNGYDREGHRNTNLMKAVVLPAHNSSLHCALIIL
jgi:hypothetical protein